MTADGIPADRLAAYDSLIATVQGLARRGRSMPYTSVNGHMSSFLSPVGSLALRLPPGTRERFLEEHATRLHEAHGTVMREYVAVPDALFGDTARLAPVVAESHAYVASLPPKPTKWRGR